MLGNGENSKRDVQNDDPSFPGENWFFYWRTSFSLWKSKIAKIEPFTTIYIPINWAFHTESGDHYDFGNSKPETDLKYLADIAHEASLEIVFLLPLCPVPYLANGGIPHLLANHVATYNNGLNYAFLDQDGHINKFYSFFDPRVHTAYKRFVWSLGQYFSHKGINAKVMGMIGGHTKRLKFISYFEDFSTVFEKGLGRFLQLTKDDSSDEELEKISLVKKESKNQKKFKAMIELCYIESAEQCLGGHWGGILKYSFLGGSPGDIFNRYSGAYEHPTYYFPKAFEVMLQDVIPSSVLLSHAVKDNVLEDLLKEFTSSILLKDKMDNGIAEEEFDTSFLPLRFFEIYQTNLDSWNQVGLFSYLRQGFEWTYVLRDDLKHLERPEYASERVHLFDCRDLDEIEIKLILKLFLNGGRVILNRDGASDEVNRKIEAFVLSNKLIKAKINFTTLIEKVDLGDGSLVMFGGDRLLKLSLSKQLDFWNSIIDLFGVMHFELDYDEGVFSYTQTRAAGHNELSYEEIRRLSIFNPTNYKRKVKILPSKNFALIRLANNRDVDIKSGNGVHIELKPNGHAALDFGHFV